MPKKFYSKIKKMINKVYKMEDNKTCSELLSFNCSYDITIIGDGE